MSRQPAGGSLDRLAAAQRVIRAIWRGPKPVLAAVEGFAVGAGAALACACDRVVAASDATFSTAFTGVGLGGDMGIFASLSARAGAAAAKQLMMLPRRLTAAECAVAGARRRAREPGAALAAAVADAEILAAGAAPGAGRHQEHAVPRQAAPEELLDAEIELQAALMDTDDFAEGIAAFAERLLPVFRGR